MNELHLNRINQFSPYHVGKVRTNVFLFHTEAGTVYTILFKEDMLIAGCQSYQFMINRMEGTKSTNDDRIRQTVVEIIHEFFEVNNDILLYICDTSDGKEAARNRLFIKWFTESTEKERYTIKTAYGKVEKEYFYTAIIFQNSHPKYDDIIEEFNIVSQKLTEKP